MLDVSYAANSGVKVDQTTDVLESTELLDILKNMNDAELSELEDELNFAHFAGVFGPILSNITNESNTAQRRSGRETASCAA
jgi:hypothetical protein